MIYVAKEMQRLNMKVPLLIGGATTSRIHTAVKISPNYKCPTVHVLDASRSVVVVSSLLDSKLRDDYSDDVAADYENLRQEHYASLKDRKYVSLDYARARAPKVNWARHEPITVPSFLGTKVRFAFLL
jgi:5-methyltetrahydrofolate--homocysteine methyltransferase